MFKSFATNSSIVAKSSLAAGLAMIGALVLAPQEASAGRFGGFHGGGGFHVAAAPHFAMARPAFHPVFRPAFHPAFRPAVHFAPRHVNFGGGRPIRSAGFGRQEREHGLGRERGHERTRVGRLEHERGRHFRLPHGGYGQGFDQPDYSEPDTMPVSQALVGPEAMPANGGPAPVVGPAPQGPIAKAASCAAAGSSVLVTFAPKATATDISNFLKAYNVTIVDGPAQDGRYRLRLSDKQLPPNEVMQAVTSMQTQTTIVAAISVL